VPGPRVNARRDLNLVSAASAAAIVGWSMIALLLPLLALRFGVGAGGIGLLVAAAAVLPLLLAVPIGTAVDRWGARRIMALSFAGTAVVMLPMVAQPSLTWLVVAYVVGSALQNGFIIGAQALIAALGAEGRSREVAYGWWTTAMAAGQVVGPIAAGLLLDRLGVRPAFVGVFASLALAVAFMLAVRTRGRSETFVPPFRWRAATALLRDRTVGIAVLTSTAAVWAMTIHATFLPVHLESLAMSAVTIGVLLSLRSAAAVVIRPVMPQVIALLGGRERTVVYTLVALVVGLAGVIVHPSPWLIGLWVVLFGAGHGLSQPISMVMVADRVAARERGAALGVRLMLNRSAQVLAPLAFVWVAGGIGLQALFLAHAVLVAVAAVVLMAWTRRGVGGGG
jgi:MFS family permease